VTGEVGAGKTTLVRGLLAALDKTKVIAAQLVSTQLDAEDTLRMVAAAYGVRFKTCPRPTCCSHWKLSSWISPAGACAACLSSTKRRT